MAFFHSRFPLRIPGTSHPPTRDVSCEERSHKRRLITPCPSACTRRPWTAKKCSTTRRWSGVPCPLLCALLRSGVSVTRWPALDGLCVATLPRNCGGDTATCPQVYRKPSYIQCEKIQETKSVENNSDLPIVFSRNFCPAYRTVPTPFWSRW